jgi:hypothetical protein
MKTTLQNNGWITVNETRKGATVKRKYAGLETLCDINDVVMYCRVKYWEVELYPNGEISKEFLRTYTLIDLERQEWEEITGQENVGTEEEPVMQDIKVTKFMNQKLVLSGFIQALGNNYIVAPTRETLENIGILPLEHEELYPLHRDTRAINIL